MQTESNRIESLFKKYLDQSISREEFNEFWLLLNEQGYESLTPQLQNLWLRTEGIAALYSDEEWNRRLKALIQKAETEDAVGKGRNGYAKNATPVKRMWRWVAAASIIILVGVLVTLRLSKGRQDNEQPVATTHDVAAPNETRAVLTLADGRKIYLDSADNGTLAQENNVNVVKTEDGKIVYDATPHQTQVDKPVYNTLTNPRGSKVIDMTFSDGSHVWLNAGSSVKYPVAFIGKERVVEMTGEAYFEVKHNAAQPFKVHLPNGSIVEDIGTSFNINAYSDEESTKTTLLEGSVKVESPALTGTPFSKGGKPTHSVVLSPGQQAVVSNNIQVKKDVDVDEVMAWKNGWFEFENTSIPIILRQVSRWYDMEIVYTKSAGSETFGGRISKDLPLSNVLRSLEQNSKLKFRIEGKRLIVE